MKRVLITGIAGSVAKLTAKRFLSEGCEVFGIDYRPKPKHFDLDLPYVQANYNKTKIEDCFRSFKPTTVLHLGRVGNLKTTLNKRFDLNVVGSAKVMELCTKYKVERLIVFSTFHIYGAHPHNHIPIFEDEPLRATRTFPELADAVQLDNLACTRMYQEQKVCTTVLRPVNIVGPYTRNTVSRYLRMPRKVYVFGYNPMWQFIHHDDMVQALWLCANRPVRGVFNVSAQHSLPILDAMQLSGGKSYPIPGPIAHAYLQTRRRFRPTLPSYLIDFLRFPCVVSGQRFREAFDFKAEHGLLETLSVGGPS